MIVWLCRELCRLLKGRVYRRQQRPAAIACTSLTMHCQDRSYIWMYAVAVAHLQVTLTTQSNGPAFVICCSFLKTLRNFPGGTFLHGVMMCKQQSLRLYKYPGPRQPLSEACQSGARGASHFAAHRSWRLLPDSWWQKMECCYSPEGQRRAVVCHKRHLCMVLAA